MKGYIYLLTSLIRQNLSCKDENSIKDLKKSASQAKESKKLKKQEQAMNEADKALVLIKEM